MASLFQPTKTNTSLIKKWIIWYRQMQIVVKIVEPLLNAGTLTFLCCFGVELIILFFILIRLGHLLNSFVILFLTSYFILVCGFTIVGWETVADIYDNTANVLVKLQRAEAYCSFVSRWQSDVYLRAWKEYMQRKEYSRVAKTTDMRPIVPLGFANHTFFVATKSCKVQSIKILALIVLCISYLLIGNNKYVAEFN